MQSNIWDSQEKQHTSQITRKNTFKQKLPNNLACSVIVTNNVMGLRCIYAPAGICKDEPDLKNASQQFVHRYHLNLYHVGLNLVPDY